MTMKRRKQEWRSTCVSTGVSFNLMAHWTNRLDVYRKMSIFGRNWDYTVLLRHGILFTYLGSVRQTYSPQILCYRDIKLVLFSVTDTSFPVRHICPREKKNKPNTPKIQNTHKKPPIPPPQNLVTSSLASPRSQVMILKTYISLSLEVQHSLVNFCTSKPYHVRHQQT